MSTETLSAFLMWCSIINLALLLVSGLGILLLHRPIYRLHNAFFPMPEETHRALLYGMMGGYKILVFVFNVVPWIALQIVT